MCGIYIYTNYTSYDIRFIFLSNQKKLKQSTSPLFKTYSGTSNSHPNYPALTSEQFRPPKKGRNKEGFHGSPRT